MDMERAAIPLERLLEVPYVDSFEGYEVSPDGKMVAYASNPTGQWEIYLLPLDGSSPARMVSQGEGGKFAPRWSPDGKRLAYILDRDGGECYDIYVFNLQTNRHLNLTPDTDEAIQTAFSWSPDGKWLTFVSDRSGRFEGYRVVSSGGEAQRLPELPYPLSRVVWSPDGRWIAAVVEARGQDANIYLIPVNGGEPFPISLLGKPINARGPAWSSDGRWLAFSSDVAGSYNIGILEAASRQLIWLTKGGENKEAPAWSKDGKRLVYTCGIGPKNIIQIYDRESKTTINRLAGVGVHNRPQFVDDSDELVFAYNDPTRPNDLWLYEPGLGRTRPLTSSLPPPLQGLPFVMPVEVTYPSLDGRDVPALLYRPRCPAVRRPAVVYVHGGPNWLTQITWDPLVQHMLSWGWVVLAPNYRGSTDYSREWQLANRFDFGGKDTQDIVAGARYLVEAGFANRDRIAITGRSYGGYLTMTCLTQYPSYWAGGSAIVPFINWFTGHRNSRADLQHWDRENFGDPDKDYDLYYERSPFFFLDRVQAPVQLICGAHDPRCPASESIQARNKLLELGKVCDFVLYEDEGHSFLKTQNVLDHKKRLVEFLAGLLED